MRRRPTAPKSSMLVLARLVAGVHRDGGRKRRVGRRSATVILVRDPELGKWGGRVVADLLLDGRSLSEVLIASGHGPGL